MASDVFEKRIGEERMDKKLSMRLSGNSRLSNWIRRSPVILILIASPATAKDLNMLARILYTADLASQLSNQCTLADPQFEKAGGPLGDVLDYTQHIKGEVIAELRESEAALVLESAAGAARTSARSFIKSFSGPLGVDASRLAKWCREASANFDRQIMTTHDRHHDKLDALIADAKRE